MGLVQAGLISDLNALSASTIGEYDYECRLQAYGRLSAQCFGKLTYEQAVLVISQGLYDIRSDDISIRHSGSNCLSNFVQFLASICDEIHQSGYCDEIHQSGLGGEMKDGGSAISEKGSVSGCWNQESVRVAVQKLLLPNVRRSMGLDSLTVRRVRKFPILCSRFLLGLCALKGKALQGFILEGTCNVAIL